MKKKKFSSVEWFSNRAYELFEQYSEGNFNRTILNKLMLETTIEAQKRHKEEMIKAIETLTKKNINKANNIIIAFTNIKGELFMYDQNQAEQYYNETYEN